PLRQLAMRLDAEARPVDLWQEEALREFFRGCVAVVNCAGPSYQVLDRVARAAASAHAHYVDVSGDGPAWHLLQGQPAGDKHWTAVLSAGMLPGLANLVPGWMSQSAGGELT
ncbi:Saccharopine dehydrogenase, partial [Salmonella enterica subsp. enterica serovar Rubislaw]|nr:Saccharopine dehydrogenase [Salmonella enterica subsp. enterica serovar Rubislaw]